MHRYSEALNIPTLRRVVCYLSDHQVKWKQKNIKKIKPNAVTMPGNLKNAGLVSYNILHFCCWV